MGAELGVRSADQCRNRPPGEAAQADRGARPGVLRGAEGPGDRIRGRPAGLQRCPEAQSLRPDLGHPQDSLVRPADSSLPHTVARHPEGIPGGRRGCDDVPLDLDQGRDPRLHVGRGRLDPGGQRPDGQRRFAAQLPPLQDVPGLRQTPVKAFVTGGTGFVGAHLVRALRARGDTVTCLVRSTTKAQALGWTNVRLIRGDLHDAAALREGCADAEVVYHVAGRISARDLDEFMRANRDGTANVLEAAAQVSLQRFVLVSSLAAAGPTVPGKPIDETRPPSPVTPYGQSKLAAEGLVRGLLWTIGSIAHLAGRATLLSGDKAAEFLAPAWTCRADALARDAGWRAETDLETGLRRTAAWYRREGWL